MNLSIEVVKLEGDHTDYLERIIAFMQKSFTTLEQFELRYEVFALDIAMTLGGRMKSEGSTLTFDFTGLLRHN